MWPYAKNRSFDSPNNKLFERVGKSAGSALPTSAATTAYNCDCVSCVPYPCQILKVSRDIPNNQQSLIGKLLKTSRYSFGSHAVFRLKEQKLLAPVCSQAHALACMARASHKTIQWKELLDKLRNAQCSAGSLGMFVNETLSPEHWLEVPIPQDLEGAYNFFALSHTWSDAQVAALKKVCKLSEMHRLQA